MCPADQVQSIVPIELLDDISAKEPSRASVAYLPPSDFLGVAPHEVADGPFRGDFLAAGEASDLGNRADVGRKTAVEAEGRVFD
jgi:hypothetical protein